jgi:hypothetical protein
MELTRRDALAALAVGGTAVGVGTAALGDGTDGSGPDAAGGDDRPDGAGAGIGGHERETLVAVARVVYPSAVTGIERFLGTYLDGRAETRPGFVPGVAEAVTALDRMGEDWHGGTFVDLAREVRERLLREAGADTAEADPDGSPAERIRYYLINEPLYALYASPTGGELVGIENPQGYPGGTDSYQRGPST